MTIDDAVERITNYLPRCSIKKLQFIWNTLYEDWEDFPDEKEEALELIEEELSCAENIKIKKIYKNVFKEQFDNEE